MNTDDETKENYPDAERVDLVTSWKIVLASWLADVLLFCATAVVVIWQNSRITVLYDLAGVLEPAYRMSLGDRPYADFPFPYTPLTFLIQSWIIRLWGTVYWHHIAYVAIVAGLASVLTWRAITNILLDSFRWPRSAAFLLSLPIVILGIYCIFPHPFYDPDAMFFILVSLAAILWLERRGFPTLPTFCAGMLLVIPLFVKQNIGLAYLGSWLITLIILLAAAAWKKLPYRGYLALIAGSVAGIAISAALISWWVGLSTFKYWIWDFARLRRTPSVVDMVAVYQDPLLLVWLVSFGTGALLFWLPSLRTATAETEECETTGFAPASALPPPGGLLDRLLLVLSIILMSVPFLWPVVYLLIDDDASERGERLANVWPFVLIVSLVLCVLSSQRVAGIRKLLPFILVVTAHGVFLSQQLWGSTYG
ncbi:MAG TPA: hypothetical protein VGJ02_08020, partial [Pyrinomonadaceae bacterium]